jgi:hypothetical protein
MGKTPDIVCNVFRVIVMCEKAFAGWINNMDATQILLSADSESVPSVIKPDDLETEEKLAGTSGADKLFRTESRRQPNVFYIGNAG